MESLDHRAAALSRFCIRFSQRGVTSIEYGLIAALIAIAIIGAVASTGDANEEVWTAWTNAVIKAIAIAFGK